MREAMDYLEKKGHIFRSIGPFDEFELAEPVLDVVNNKIFYCNPEEAVKKVISSSRESNLEDVCMKLNQLADKIQENADLLAQLNFILRDVAVFHTKEFDINLIVQNLRYLSSQCKEQRMHFGHIAMTADTPLAFLGCVAQILLTPFAVCNIACDKHTAAVCSLFVQLCKDSGLEQVTLLITEKPGDIPMVQEDVININTITVIDSGCIGVIAERCDVDSAIDALLNTTDRFPWRLRRVLVQESIYNTFKDTMRFKTGNDAAKNIDHYSKKCAETFVHRRKLFLVDYTDFDVKHEYWQIILVETYRTNMELLSMIKSYRPLSMSLWVNNIVESNEITFGVDVPIIWINDVSIFDGPQKASQAFYDQIILGYSSEVYKKRYSDILDDLLKRRSDWLKIPSRKRRLTIFGHIEEFLKESGEKDLLKKFIDLKCHLDWSTENFFNIDNEKKKTCMCIDEPVGLMALPCNLDDCHILDFDILRSLIQGNMFISDNCRDSKLLSCFRSKGLPVALVDTYEDDSRIGTAYMLYHTRVIWTTY